MPAQSFASGKSWWIYARVPLFVMVASLVSLSISVGFKVLPQNDDLTFELPIVSSDYENDDAIDVFASQSVSHSNHHFSDTIPEYRKSLNEWVSRKGEQQHQHRDFNYVFKGKKRTIARNKKYNKTLFFVHIHKSAGSLICHHTFRNRVASNARQNCNVQSDQRCCGNSDTVQAQISYALTTKYDFVAIERDMYDSMAPDYYDYIAAIRDSKARYYSHWRHLRRLIPVNGTQHGGYGNSGWLMGDVIKEWKSGDDPKTTWQGSDPLGDFKVWSDHQPDNWNTRIFCGPKCRVRAQFQITADLFIYTLKRLTLFRHIMFVEDMGNSFRKFAEAYGWEPETESIVKNVGSNSGNLTEQEWNPLMSALDDALYEFCKRIFNNDTLHLWDDFSNQAQVDKYFSEGHVYGCSNACCGSCSIY